MSAKLRPIRSAPRAASVKRSAVTSAAKAVTAARSTAARNYEREAIPRLMGIGVTPSTRRFAEGKTGATRTTALVRK